MFENLLQWSRAQIGNIEVKKQKIFLHKLVEENIQLIQPMAKDKSIVVTSDIADKTTAFADINLLDTVIRNLLTNAIKFTDNGRVEVYANSNISFIELCIKDTGVGISSENLKKLFKIDKNTSTSGTKGESETGLGLLICKEFFELQGGKIKVESKVKEGSIFIISLPKNVT